jgi:type I restriction enzyme R subunit
MDFKGATRLFSDADFDGEPVVIYTPKPGEPVVPPDDAPGPNGKIPGLDDVDDENNDDSLFGDPNGKPGGVQSGRAKYVIDDVSVKLAAQRSLYLDVDGKLITEDYRVLLKDQLQTSLQQNFGSLTDFLRRWDQSERKQAILEELDEHGVPLAILQQAVPNGSELDVFDLVAHVAFNQKPLTRRERANNVKKHDVFGKYGEQARTVLEALLEKFADHGVQNIENTKVLELPPFDQVGSKTQIRRGIFGELDHYNQAIRELENELYRDDIPA